MVTALASFVCLSSCKEDAATKSRGQIPANEPVMRSVATSKEARSPFDFEATLNLINRINNGGSYEFFQSEWEELHSRLRQAAADGSINELPKEQRSELWWALEYMRACARPEIFRDHNEEIIPILFSFDLPDLNQQLKEILADSGQL